MLAGENIGEFGKLMANCQSLLPQIYTISIAISFVGYLPKLSPPNNLSSLFHQCFLLPTFSTIQYVCNTKWSKYTSVTEQAQ